MALADLRHWLTELPGFRGKLAAVVVDSVASQFTTLSKPENSNAEPHDWTYLLLCASALAGSDSERAQDAALRIAHYCLVTRDSLPEQKDAAAVILDVMTNRPAIRLAENRGMISEHFATRLPTPLQQDLFRRALEFRVSLSTHETIHTNRFQQEFWTLTEHSDWLRAYPDNTPARRRVMTARAICNMAS